jgi:glycosyltransferase involved in cell wall biosynthesis
MRLTFLLPRSGDNPIGGFKVVYEYANGLAQIGHEVTVVHAPPTLFGTLSMASQFNKLTKFASRAMGFKGGFRPKRWFSVDPRVRMMWLPSLHHRWIPEGDAVVSTAWQTAEWAQTYPANKGKKYYFIHDYEYYMVADATIKRRMEMTYLAGMRNIVTSPAGEEMLEGCCAAFDAYIPNGIDFSIYKLTLEADSNARNLIGFPTRQEHFKGTEDALKALEIVRSNTETNLNVWSFGGKRPDFMPDWVEYHERPTDREMCELYNRSRIFIVPSHFEGWGLPGAEAMACGSALVSTDNVGVRAYAEHGRTALLSHPMDPISLTDNVQRLLRDERLRLQIAQEGHHHIQQFTWEHAISSMDTLFRGKH